MGVHHDGSAYGGRVLVESRALVERARKIVGGVDEHLSRASYAMLSALSASSVPGIKAMLVHGPGGVGKSAMVDAMIQAGGWESVRAHASDLYSAIE